MIHTIPITVSSNVAPANPSVTILKLSACIITACAIEFPSGCSWLVGVRIKEKEHQLYPTTPDQWICSDGQLIRWDDNTQIVDAPYELVIETYNEDEIYDHTIRVYVDTQELNPQVVTRTTVTIQQQTLGV